MMQNPDSPIRKTPYPSVEQTVAATEKALKPNMNEALRDVMSGAAKRIDEGLERKIKATIEPLARSIAVINARLDDLVSGHGTREQRVIDALLDAMESGGGKTLLDLDHARQQLADEQRRYEKVLEENADKSQIIARYQQENKSLGEAHYHMMEAKRQLKDQLAIAQKDIEQLDGRVEDLKVAYLTQSEQLTAAERQLASTHHELLSWKEKVGAYEERDRLERQNTVINNTIEQFPGADIPSPFNNPARSVEQYEAQVESILRVHTPMTVSDVSDWEATVTQKRIAARLAYNAHERVRHASKLGLKLVGIAFVDLYADIRLKNTTEFFTPGEHVIYDEMLRRLSDDLMRVDDFNTTFSGPGAVADHFLFAALQQMRGEAQVANRELVMALEEKAQAIEKHADDIAEGKLTIAEVLEQAAKIPVNNDFEDALKHMQLGVDLAKGGADKATLHIINHVSGESAVMGEVSDVRINDKPDMQGGC